MLVKQLILVAPPVHNFNFSILPEFECPWVVVQGEQDEVVPAEEVFKWIHSRRQAPEIIKMANVGHFFHGALMILQEKLLAVISV